MSVICAKGYEELANSGYPNICFTINSLLKILPRHFRYFHCYNFKMTFDKDFLKKSRHFLTSSKFLLCHKLLRSGDRGRLMITGNTFQTIPEVCKKLFFGLFTIFNLYIYEIFNFCSF